MDSARAHLDACERQRDPVTAPPGFSERRHTARHPALRRSGPLHVACAPRTGVRPSVRGKFLFVGEDKLYVRGATYGTFRPNRSGELYPPPSAVARDFAQMAQCGFNALRTYTIPPHWLLDAAAEKGLFVLVGIAWEQHVDFLEERRRARSIENRLRSGVASCAGHPAVLGYTAGNEIPSQIVRWLGRRRVERYIARLYRAAKNEDPGGLVTYVNYPPTEYLQLGFLDFMCFNVYLETRAAFDAYLARLQNISGELPLVMAEIGLDSRTHGEEVQAEVLNWQVRTALASGCAGAFVFAWTDEWYVSYLSEVAAVDAVPDQDWLLHLAASFEDTDYAGVGGPNVPPPTRSAIAACFADAPGTPIHVLISDREAEHIPGCNMAFRKRTLEEVGGFEMEFRIAGDDVDLCWRLLAAGHRLGFNAAALVWHKPRSSLRAYWRQQREYGRAEAMLERRWPDRYRGVHAHWAGRIYSRGPLGLGRSRVYYGTWGSELFQSLYSPPAGALCSFLGAPEWHLWIAALALMSIAGLAWTPLLLAAPVLAAALGLTLAAAARSAA